MQLKCSDFSKLVSRLGTNSGATRKDDWLSTASALQKHSTKYKDKIEMAGNRNSRKNETQTIMGKLTYWFTGMLPIMSEGKSLGAGHDNPPTSHFLNSWCRKTHRFIFYRPWRFPLCSVWNFPVTSRQRMFWNVLNVLFHAEALMIPQRHSQPFLLRYTVRLFGGNIAWMLGSIITFYEPDVQTNLWKVWDYRNCKSWERRRLWT